MLYYAMLLLCYFARVYDYDTIRYVTSLAAKLACLHCVLPGPRILLSICLSVHLCFCRACGRVSLSRVCVRVCACDNWSDLFCMSLSFAYMHMYVGMYVCGYIYCGYVYMYVYGYVTLCRYGYLMPSQPASQPEKRRKKIVVSYVTYYVCTVPCSSHTHAPKCANNDN